jgi:hypothetical protein
MQRTSPNAAPIYDVIQSLMLTALTDGRRFSHIERLNNAGTLGLGSGICAFNPLNDHFNCGI